MLLVVGLHWNLVQFEKTKRDQESKRNKHNNDLILLLSWEIVAMTFTFYVIQPFVAAVVAMRCSSSCCWRCYFFTWTELCLPLSLSVSPPSLLFLLLVHRFLRFRVAAEINQGMNIVIKSSQQTTGVTRCASTIIVCHCLIMICPFCIGIMSMLMIMGIIMRSLR